MKKSILSVKDLSKTYPKKKEKVQALKGISFSLHEGEKLGLVGESGSGKTTLLKILTGLEKPSSGDIFLKEQSIRPWVRREQKDLYRQMQMVFQNPLLSFNPRKTLRDSVFEPSRLLRPDLSPQERQAQIYHLMDRVDMDPEFLDSYPHLLSGGQCQRLALVRALSVRPSILLCDEVTSALDILIQKQVVDLLNKFNEDPGISIIFVTHNLALAYEFCDRILVLKEGICLEEGDPREIFHSPKDPYTQSLIRACVNPLAGIQKSK